MDYVDDFTHHKLASFQSYKILIRSISTDKGASAVRRASSVSEQLLDEGHHLLLVDSAAAILVEGGEDLIEGFLGELVSGSEVSKSVLDELLGLFLVEFTGIVDIVGLPTLVDNTLDSLFFWRGHLI